MSEDLLRDDNALGSLRAEHTRIEELLASCLESEQVEFTKQALIPLFQELDAHSAMERQIFFPFISRLVDPGQIDRPAANLDEMDRLADRLEGVDPTDASYFDILNELIDVFHRHAYTEEEFLFLPVEMSTPDVHNDLVRAGIKMRDVRTELLKRARPRRTDVVASQQARAETRQAMVEPTETTSASRPVEQIPPMSTLAGVGNESTTPDRVRNELRDSGLSDNELDDSDLPIHRASTDDWDVMVGEIDIVTWDLTPPSDEQQPGV